MGRWFSNINLYRGTSFGVCISNCFLGIATRTVLICQTQKLKAKVTLLLWLLGEKLRVPRWKSWTTFHVYWVSHPCPHTLFPSPGLPSCPLSLYCITIPALLLAPLACLGLGLSLACILRLLGCLPVVFSSNLCWLPRTGKES